MCAPGQRHLGFAGFTASELTTPTASQASWRPGGHIGKRTPNLAILWSAILPQPSCHASAWCFLRAQMPRAVPGRLLSVRRTCGHELPSAFMQEHVDMSVCQPALTRQIKEATTIKSLLCVQLVQKGHLNDIHLSGCWTTLGRLAKQGRGERCWLQMNAEALEPLVQGTVRAAGV